MPCSCRAAARAAPVQVPGQHRQHQAAAAPEVEHAPFRGPLDAADRLAVNGVEPQLGVRRLPRLDADAEIAGRSGGNQVLLPRIEPRPGERPGCGCGERRERRPRDDQRADDEVAAEMPGARLRERAERHRVDDAVLHVAAQLDFRERHDRRQQRRGDVRREKRFSRLRPRRREHRAEPEPRPEQREAADEHTEADRGGQPTASRPVGPRIRRTRARAAVGAPASAPPMPRRLVEFRLGAPIDAPTFRRVMISSLRGRDEVEYPIDTQDREVRNLFQHDRSGRQRCAGQAGLWRSTSDSTSAPSG